MNVKNSLVLMPIKQLKAKLKLRLLAILYCRNVKVLIMNMRYGLKVGLLCERLMMKMPRTSVKQ